jgi:signal transduction histidine kinase
MTGCKSRGVASARAQASRRPFGILRPYRGEYRDVRGDTARYIHDVLHEFLIARRADILERSRAKLVTGDRPVPTAAELTNGLPVFVDQLIAILGQEKSERAVGHLNVGLSASLHGGELMRMGLTVGQVVQDYGSICQSVTELADEGSLSITADEFQTFNRCLDDAIAQAVTAYEQLRDRQARSSGTLELGSMVHEMRNLVTTSMLTFDALKKGAVGLTGSTSSLLGSSLKRMRILLDRTLAEVRFNAKEQVRERVSIVALIEEAEIVATIEAPERDIQLSIDRGSADVAVDGDRQILASALSNLVQNALKFTRSHGRIGIRAHTAGERVLIEVNDECGGLPPGEAEELFRPFAQRGADKSGLGLGLPISRKGIRACGGEIHVLDRPGVGCTFTIELPRAARSLAAR